MLGTTLERDDAPAYPMATQPLAEKAGEPERSAKRWDLDEQGTPSMRALLTALRIACDVPTVV